MNESQGKAKLLKDDGKFEEAAKIYKELYDKDGDKWDGWSLAFCFNKLKKYKEALSLSEKIYQEDGNFDYIRSPYAWSLYMAKINQKSSDFDAKNIEKNLDIILNLEKENKFWSGIALIQTLDHFSKNNNWEAIYRISKKIDPAILDNKSRMWEGNRISSDREKWYAKATKACEKLEKWTDCLEISKKGIEEFPNSSVWIERRYALSQGYSGYIDKSIALLKDVLIKKNEWFIYCDIAKMYRKNSNLIEEKNYLIQGCFLSKDKPDPGFRCEMYYELGCNLLTSNDYIEYGKLHIQLSYAVRKEEGWPIPENLQSVMKEYNIEEQFEKSGKQFINELSSFWEKEKPNLYADQEKKTGKIKVLIGDGSAGFISSSGDDYYFTFANLNFNGESVETGLEVSFFLEKSFDIKKQEDSFKAVEISKL
jgi:tetratricopeptide (TPR) repeat protein